MPTVIDNQTRSTTVATHARVADNLWTRLRGLIGSKPLGQGDGLLIVPSRSIHTHFMRFPIDVLYISSDLEVVGLDEAMAPWRVGRQHRKARCVLELPAGMIASTSTQVGDKLQITGYRLR